MSLVVGSGLALAGRLEETDLRIEGGSLTCLVGPNGSGKTSLLHALAGIGSPKGEVRIGGRALADAGPVERVRLLSYLPANRELRWPLVARDLVALSGAVDDEVEAVLERLALREVAQRRVDRLSTGERGRVLIARALAPSPTLLLLDEPIANLDPLWQLRLMALVREEVTASERAALVAMHDLDMAARFADRLLVMDGGRIVADGVPAGLMASGVVEQVFGIRREAGHWVPA